MKRIVMLLTALLMLATFLTACGSSSSESEVVLSAPAEGEAAGETEWDKDADVIEIRENLFIAQTNDMYLNPEDYDGKTIRYEGIFKQYTWEDMDGAENIQYYVIRYGPGCCGFDGEAGFEICWDEGAEPEQYPEIDDWVEVVGTLEVIEYASGWELLQVRISSLTVLDERGEEFVAA